MAYFPNGTEASISHRKYCERCVHQGTAEKECPVMDLHYEWNREQIADATKGHAIDTLWPNDDVWPDQCAMFIERNEP